MHGKKGSWNREIHVVHLWHRNVKHTSPCTQINRRILMRRSQRRVCNLTNGSCGTLVTGSPRAGGNFSTMFRCGLPRHCDEWKLGTGHSVEDHGARTVDFTTDKGETWISRSRWATWRDPFWLQMRSWEKVAQRDGDHNVWALRQVLAHGDDHCDDPRHGATFGQLAESNVPTILSW